MATQQPLIAGGESRVHRKVEANRNDGAVVSENHQEPEKQVGRGSQNSRRGLAQCPPFKPAEQFQQRYRIHAEHERSQPGRDPHQHCKVEKYEDDLKWALSIACQQGPQPLLARQADHAE